MEYMLYVLSLYKDFLNFFPLNVLKTEGISESAHKVTKSYLKYYGNYQKLWKSTITCFVCQTYVEFH